MTPSPERSRLPGKMTRRLAATTLIGQGMTVFFGGLVARQLEVAADDPDGRANTYLIGGIALAVLCILVSGLLRRRWGIWLGWGVQVLTLVSALALPAMALVAIIFGGVWWLCLSQGHKVDQLTAEWASAEQSGNEQASAPHPDGEPHTEAGLDHGAAPDSGERPHTDHRPEDD